MSPEIGEPIGVPFICPHVILSKVLRQSGATDEAKDLLRHQVSSLLMSHRKTHSLLRNERKALRELKADNEIVILPTDKGRPTVILHKVDYQHKTRMLLNDLESYKVSDAASLKSLVANVNRILARLKKGKVITVKDWYMAKPAETAMARFYGLPKVHTPDVPSVQSSHSRHTHIRACELAHGRRR
nr:unnamed protein product [Spirometra erinaceieuropaei]